jgi:NAD(P)-dependent dehydrogenase (short-subunit alcohol dehydrogenase family)
MTLEGRVALVTGAAGRGIGRSIAFTLARGGADIAVNYRRSADEADAVVKAIEGLGRQAVALAADVGDAAAVERMCAEAIARFGRIDIVVNSAGGPWKPQDITEIAPEHLHGVLAREVEATFHLLRLTLPGMRQRRWGRFISIGGHMADDWRFGPPEAPLDYPMGKAMRHWLTRTLAPREIERGITINAVAPGPTPHISIEEALALAQGSPRDAGTNTPQDIADVVSFLCGDAAARVTGAVIPVPGAHAV